MMISPNGFIEQHKDKSYEELLPVRDRLIRQIRYYEKHADELRLDATNPSPEVVYQCNLKYLAKLSDLIAEKYNKEIVWAKDGDSRVRN